MSGLGCGLATLQNTNPTQSLSIQIQTWANLKTNPKRRLGSLSGRESCSRHVCQHSCRLHVSPGDQLTHPSKQGKITLWPGQWLSQKWTSDLCVPRAKSCAHTQLIFSDQISFRRPKKWGAEKEAVSWDWGTHRRSWWPCCPVSLTGVRVIEGPSCREPLEGIWGEGPLVPGREDKGLGPYFRVPTLSGKCLLIPRLVCEIPFNLT